MTQDQQYPLRQLLYIRALVTAFLVTATGAGVFLFDLAPVLVPITVLLALMVLVLAASWWRLRSRLPVTDAELLAHLAVDGLLYAGFLYFTGGGTNPLVFVLLIPVIVAAATLPGLHTLMLSAGLVAVYSALLLWYRPLGALSHSHGPAPEGPSFIDLHILGMWLNFLLTVAIAGFFVLRMQQMVRQRDRQLHAERERRIRDQQVLTLATITAGTAHELATPLNTMQVVLDDLDESEPRLKGEFDLLREQVGRCSRKLRSITDRARNDNAALVPVTDLVERVLGDWQLLRPRTQWRLEHDGDGQPPRVRVDVALEQALINLLNNAADACEQGLEISLAWSPRHILMRLRDRGPGVSAETMSDLGRPFVTTKSGLGIGLFLTTSTLRDRDGEVHLFNHPAGGAVTEIHLKPEGIG